jgi:hypothetical protein
MRSNSLKVEVHRGPGLSCSGEVSALLPRARENPFWARTPPLPMRGRNQSSYAFLAGGQIVLVGVDCTAPICSGRRVSA